MFAKVAVLVVLFGLSYSKVLMIKNAGQQKALSVTVSGVSDVIALRGQAVPVTVPDNYSGTISGMAIAVEGEETKSTARTQVKIQTGETDTYSVSVEQGYNLGAKITPIGDQNCGTGVCITSPRACPVEHQELNSLNEVVACRNNPVLAAICPKALSSLETPLNVLTCSNATGYLIMFV